MEKEIEISTGEVIHIRPVSSTLLNALANMELPEPEPPIVEIETAVEGYKQRRVDREDPEYQERLRRREEEIGNVASRLLLALGVVEDPPDGVLKHLEPILAKLGIEPKDVFDYKCLWVENVLLANLRDRVKVQSAINVLSGLVLETQERLVEAFEASFRGGLEGNEASELDAAGEERD